ncbi:probable 28S ribosomal protein S6, mitochondrial [Orussus abietinus]|uniref:probable 28S ribosomal protein S6, mitochondrial n=1 Tax=Orussus abietinus TaxID=222816 RepID=UPI000625BD75|nr:probable 28S ribosomal protein S6, mitochondrial [Orussus abietinus]
MPTYELPLLLRIMSKKEIASTLKRTATAIFGTGGFIRKIENLGKKEMPYKISAHQRVHREANYFIIYFDAPPKSLEDIKDHCTRDIDVIRNRIYKQNEVDVSTPCTISEDMKPPTYRADVQKVMEQTKRREARNKNKFKYNSGLDYYPF